jgi:hypothetical protein
LFVWLVVGLRTQNAPSKIAPTKANTAHTASTLSFKARSTAGASLVELIKASTQLMSAEGSCTRDSLFAHKSVPAFHSSRQTLDCTRQTNRRLKFFGSAIIPAPGIFDGEFTANTGVFRYRAGDGLGANELIPIAQLTRL